MSKKQILTISLGVALMIAALIWAFTPQPVIVEVAEVTKGRFEQTIDEDGKTRVRERYVVSAPLAGRVRRATLKAGDAVARGDIVAVMHPAAPPLLDARTERELEERVGAAEAALARAKTSVAHANAALAQNRADAQRTQKLAAQGFVSPTQRERDDLKVTLSAREAEAANFEQHAAEHQLELARAALTRSRQGWHTAGGGRGERFDIRSPVAGRVLRVTQESEAVVALGAPLLEIGDPADLEVVIDVLSGDALHILPGQPVKLERQSGAPGGNIAALEGRVRRVEPSANTISAETRSPAKAAGGAASESAAAASGSASCSAVTSSRTGCSTAGLCSASTCRRWSPRSFATSTSASTPGSRAAAARRARRPAATPRHAPRFTLAVEFRA